MEYLGSCVRVDDSRGNTPVHQPSKKKGVNLTITISDVLGLIPTYEGNNIPQFVIFKHACKQALDLIGTDNEKTLLIFLKQKLKGLIYSQLSPHLSNYKSINLLMNNLEKEYMFIDHVSTWRDQFRSIRQKKYEPIEVYASRFQYVLQSARIQFNVDYVMDMEIKPYTSFIKIDYWERVAKYIFIENLISFKLQEMLVTAYNLEVNLHAQMLRAKKCIKILKRFSTCKLCYEDNHKDEECKARKRSFYHSFKRATDQEMYAIINHEDAKYPYKCKEQEDESNSEDDQ